MVIIFPCMRVIPKIEYSSHDLPNYSIQFFLSIVVVLRFSSGTAVASSIIQLEHAGASIVSVTCVCISDLDRVGQVVTWDSDSSVCFG